MICSRPAMVEVPEPAEGCQQGTCTSSALSQHGIVLFQLGKIERRWAGSSHSSMSARLVRPSNSSLTG